MYVVLLSIAGLKRKERIAKQTNEEISVSIKIIIKVLRCIIIFDCWFRKEGTESKTNWCGNFCEHKKKKK